MAGTAGKPTSESIVEVKLNAVGLQVQTGSDESFDTVSSWPRMVRIM